MAVVGKPRAVTAEEIPKPPSFAEDVDIRSIINRITLLQKKAAWNTVALADLRSDIADLKVFFNNSNEEMSTLIDDTRSKMFDLDVSESGNILDDFNALAEKVSAVSAGISDIKDKISPLVDAGVTGQTWSHKKAAVSDLVEKVKTLQPKRTMAFVDLGVVTKDNIFSVLEEKVTSFAAVTGVLSGNQTSGWYIRQGNSGSGLLFDQDSTRILSLTKTDNKSYVKIIWGPDLEDISDLSTAEQNFVRALMSTDLTKDTWSEVLDNIVKLYDLKTWVDQVMSANLNAVLLKRALLNLQQLMSVKEEISAVTNFSVDTWKMVAEKLIKTVKKDGE